MNTTRYTLKTYWQHAVVYKRSLLQIYTLMVIAQLMEDVGISLLVSKILTKIATNDVAALSMNRIWALLIGILVLEICSHLIWNVVVRKY